MTSVPTTTADTLSTLADAIDEIASARSVDDVQRLANATARRLVAADGAALVLREDTQCHYVGEDAIEPLWKGRRFPIEDCVTGWSMLHREPVVIEDVYGDPRVSHDQYRTTFVRSLLVVPIHSADPRGALGAYWAQPHQASGEQVALLRALAGSTAVALERAMLTQELERRRVTEDDLRQLSERDALTGVLNRRAWDQLLSSALRKGTQPLFVAMLDLDHFKAYNDTHGHRAGDELLRRSARAWRSAIRAGDILARYGGEEFAVLLAGCPEERAIEIAERLRNATLHEQSVSIGLARWDGSEGAGSLVERADRALYVAKRAGRNRVALAAQA
ncbi:MAG: diguanylate cyclase/phosphodiesterase (GGDEF & EAL domains) with PAS/PAC sensor(s) [uncultured Solirubrobacteraceae bacterium]|uniref:Diguanylate cyclase/phosphodiesterase (GGDEF & EAL domains) with PAS/PAC sensor(S) n=1 Tax=uncultured Solirubrobacteraceae bacterium TaxID=1162706 RepID=A0A6J4SXF8_9ACTN|nr:MAG: diguanylate cyclase/phosphodiesterase (GGDEF & EAL domains) with PAS/PAC sensor(s) [uncultured Solirubrobacteraceae bacterium]